MVLHLYVLGCLNSIFCKNQLFSLDFWIVGLLFWPCIFLLRQIFIIVYAWGKVLESTIILQHLNHHNADFIIGSPLIYSESNHILLDLICFLIFKVHKGKSTSEFVPNEHGKYLMIGNYLWHKMQVGLQ